MCEGTAPRSRPLLASYGAFGS